MRSYDAATTDAIGAAGVDARTLVWITARNRTTGEPESVGLSNLDDHQTVTIGGDDRLYYGAGNLLGLDPIQAGVGLDVRMQRLTLSPLAPEVQQALSVYDPRLAAVEIHRALFEPLSGVLVAEPVRVFRGWVDTLEIDLSDTATATLSLASASRALTRTLTLKKSDEAARRIAPNDRFREYSDTGADVSVFWGEKKHSAKEAAPGSKSAGSVQVDPSLGP